MGGTKTIVGCEAFVGRFAAYLVQEVVEERIFLCYKWKGKSWPPYAAQIEIAAMISCKSS